MAKIKIIVGSTRPGRFGIQPATWIYNLAKEKGIEVELLDLETINLPFLDEPQPPLMGNYVKDHTKAWAAKISDSDGFVMISPEYNHSYSPVLKNAIDFLAAEWNYKPVSFISYGAAAGGTRGVEHLRSSVVNLKMFDLPDQVTFANYWEGLNDKGEFQFTEKHKASGAELLDNLVFWADTMKAARAEMPKKS